MSLCLALFFLAKVFKIHYHLGGFECFSKFVLSFFFFSFLKILFEFKFLQLFL